MQLMAHAYPYRTMVQLISYSVFVSTDAVITFIHMAYPIFYWALHRQAKAQPQTTAFDRIRPQPQALGYDPQAF